jgi:2-C-methyl-D-erythritol 4-phosphate cytidylyltransferase
MSGALRVDAILLAAGRSQRMAGIDKTIAPLRGRPLAAWSIEAFAACDAVTAIVLVSGELNHKDLEQIAEQYGGGKVTAVVPGGPRRRDSVANGLSALASGVSSSDPASSPDGEGLVAIHDTARPLVSDALIRRGIELAAQHGAAIAGARVSDTIKRVNEDGSIRKTIDRDTLRAVQTPQVFRRALLERAHSENAAGDSADATDDAMLVEAIGQPVYVYESDTPNLKVTTPDDLVVAESLLATLLSERLAGSRQ